RQRARPSVSRRPSRSSGSRPSSRPRGKCTGNPSLVRRPRSSRSSNPSRSRLRSGGESACSRRSKNARSPPHSSSPACPFADSSARSWTSAPSTLRRTICGFSLPPSTPSRRPPKRTSSACSRMPTWRLSMQGESPSCPGTSTSCEEFEGRSEKANDSQNSFLVS
ncbi:hypothetical protein PMAYCL1PPCAC_01014, partial [Pristionchus mayeri]